MESGLFSLSSVMYKGDNQFIFKISEGRFLLVNIVTLLVNLIM